MKERNRLLQPGTEAQRLQAETEGALGVSFQAGTEGAQRLHIGAEESQRLLAGTASPD